MRSSASATDKITYVPFYGGGKGQSLQIIERPDGTVTTTIVKTPNKISTEQEEEDIITTASELENPPLPTKQELDFGPNIRNIHRTALNIIHLQEIAKRNGKLSPSEETLYQQSMDSLNSSAKNLANLQLDKEQEFENREGLSEWFERKKTNKKDKDKRKEEEQEVKKKKEEEEEAKRKKQEEEDKKKKPSKEEEVGEEEEGGDNEEDDGISIGLPADEASVAEARPVGLAVAGEGGVAASKPIATAVVGPGGLAIARPVGTAIAGVAPDQALIPIYAEGYLGALSSGSDKKPSKGNTSSGSKDASSYLGKLIKKYHQF